jgi:aspartate aminotransferase
MMNVSQLIGKKYEGREICNSMEMSKILLEKAHVATIAGSSFGAEGFLRLSYATSMEDITLGLERIATFASYLK